MSAVFEQGLYAKLAASSTLAAKRIYPRLPEGVTFPAILYTRIGTSRQQAIDGNVGVTEAMVAIECVAANYSDSKTLADEVRTALHGYRGAWSTLICRHITLENETESTEQDGDRVTHWVTQIYRIWTNMD